jgi:putative effector of murein hydrolase LrgA (UPF0299 family)
MNKYVVPIMTGLLYLVGILYADSLETERQMIVQMVVVSVCLVILLIFALRKCLETAISKFVMIGIIGLHILLLYSYRNSFPMRPMTLLVYWLTEYVILLIVYVKIGVYFRFIK